jgi:hypothetical protein
MILPTVRASFTRRDALHLVDLLGRHDAELREAARQRLETGGVDALLDDPRVRSALLTDPDVTAPPAVIFYVLVRQALLEGGIDDAGTADFVASVVLAFGRAGRAYRVQEADEREYLYLVDLVERLASAREREAFMVRSHLGNFSLWMTGLFPDYLESRSRRKGGPPISYYERLGATGYRAAARSPEATSLGVDQVLDDVGRRFTRVRAALNQVSDRYLWPEAGDPVGRLLRSLSA